MTAEAGDRGSELVRMIDIHRGVGDANTISGISGVDQLHDGGDVALDCGTDGTGIGVVKRSRHDAGDGVESGDNGCETHFGGQVVYATQDGEGRSRCSECRRKKWMEGDADEKKKSRLQTQDLKPWSFMLWI